MSKGIVMFPVITEESVKQAGFSKEMPELCYTTEQGEQTLGLTDVVEAGLATSGVLYDPQCNWNAEENDLYIMHKVEIKDASVWFGSKGVCAKSGTLGLALRWSAEGSEQQGVVPFGEVVANRKHATFTGTVHFDAGIIKKRLTVETILFLKKTGEPKPEELHLCEVTGTVLGVLDQYRIVVDGNGSVFPIATVSEPEKPLWYIYFDSDDIASDLFEDEHVQFRLNTAHKDYRFIDQQSLDTYCPSLFREVMSSGLTQLIFYMKQTAQDTDIWDSIVAGNTFPTGTIADALCYFKRNLLLDMSDLQKLSESVHLFIDKNMKGELL